MAFGDCQFLTNATIRPLGIHCHNLNLHMNYHQYWTHFIYEYSKLQYIYIYIYCDSCQMSNVPPHAFPHMATLRCLQNCMMVICSNSRPTMIIFEDKSIRIGWCWPIRSLLFSAESDAYTKESKLILNQHLKNRQEANKMHFVCWPQEYSSWEIQCPSRAWLNLEKIFVKP